MIRLPRPILGARPVPLALICLAGCAALAAAFWPVDAGAPPMPPGAPPLDLARLAAGETGAALSRPLFDPERRGWTASGSRDDLTADARPQTLLTVRGILIEDRVRRALVADGTGEPAWLTPGEGRGAWRLVSIEPTEVVVADAARHYTLAFLGAPVALRHAPRRPVPDGPALRPALPPSEAAQARPRARPAAPVGAAEAAAPVRRIEITRPGSS